MKRLEGQSFAAFAHALAVVVTFVRLCILLLPALLHRSGQRGLRLVLLAASLLHLSPALPLPAQQQGLALHAAATSRRQRRLPLQNRISAPPRAVVTPQHPHRRSNPLRRSASRYRQPPAQAPPRAF